MPKMKCKCGETLNYGAIPCAIESLIISDATYEKFTGKIDAEELYDQMKHLLNCPRCRRLWVFWNGFGQPATEYLLAPDQK